MKPGNGEKIELRSSRALNYGAKVTKWSGTLQTKLLAQPDWRLRILTASWWLRNVILYDMVSSQRNEVLKLLTIILQIGYEKCMTVLSIYTNSQGICKKNFSIFLFEIAHANEPEAFPHHVWIFILKPGSVMNRIVPNLQYYNEYFILGTFQVRQLLRCRGFLLLFFKLQGKSKLVLCLYPARRKLSRACG